MHMSADSLIAFWPLESFTFEKLASTGWYAQSSGTSDWFFDIHFADANNGWAVGQTNEIVHTSNGVIPGLLKSTPIFVNLGPFCC